MNDFIPYEARVIKDSVNDHGNRLTTMVVTFPRIVLSEFNTHGRLAKNSASSRAIPVEKMIQMVEANPYVPIDWGSNQKGMQAGEELSGDAIRLARSCWLHARDNAVVQARNLLELGLHKQHTNRLLEPFMWHTVVVTATEWSNFFHLRCHPDAHPDIRRVAENMRKAWVESIPVKLGQGDWHLPFIDDEDFETEIVQDRLNRMSVARCARVSYLTHDGKRDAAVDVALYERLLQGGHMSPFEHAARPYDSHEHTDPGALRSRFEGWAQLRKLIPREADRLAPA